MNDVEALRRLQEVDLEVHRVETGLAALETETQEPRAAMKKMELLEKKAQEDLAVIQREINAREGDVQDLELKRKKAQEKLQRAASAKGLEAIQHEIAAIEEKIAAAEEAELEVMEREEQAKAMCERIATGLTQLQQKVSGLEASRPERQAEFERKRESLATDQAKWRGYLPEDLLARYDKVRPRFKGRRAVVEVDTACVACDRSFTGDERMTLMRHADQIHQCPDCQAFLLFVGAISI